MTGSSCCGAVSYHLNYQKEGMNYAKRNIDAWSKYLDGETKVEAIVVNASGCGTMIAEYGRHLRLEGEYAKKAAIVSERFRDLSQVVAAEIKTLRQLLAERPQQTKRVAFHAPCTLQHGLKLKNVVEPLLVAAGFKLTTVRDAHLCGGSAGMYSILQPILGEQLKKNKLETLTADKPEVIATANIGCMKHLEDGAPVPVRHWIELLDESLTDTGMSR